MNGGIYFGPIVTILWSLQFINIFSVQFKTFKEALAMEVRAQDHSNVETNDEKEKTNRKRKPIKFS